MKITKQILRQPIKTIAGILAILFAVTTLTICISQSVIADRTATAIRNRYCTIAVTTADAYGVQQYYSGTCSVAYRLVIRSSVASFMEKLEAEHPEVIKAVEKPGLASAYLPELTADNVSHYQKQNRGNFDAQVVAEQEAAPTYAGGIFEITVTEIGEPAIWKATGTAEDGSEVAQPRFIKVSVSGTIESVLSLQDGYADPTGRVARITLQLADQESLDALNLMVGERYLIYTADYQDGNWRLASDILFELLEDGEDVDYSEIDLNNIRTLMTPVVEGSTVVGIKEGRSYYPYGKTSVWLTESQLLWRNAAIMTVCDMADMGNISWTEHENGKYPTLDFTRYITDENGQQIQISEEEWQARYSVPTMARLDGSVEEFLASEAGAIWQRQLEYLEINQHAFPIIGVNNLNYLACFAQGDACITEGREFTEKELSGGSKVCLISETMAQINGLSVGDTISPQFYNYDYDDPNQEFLADGEGVINPWAYKFSANTPFAGEAEAYTIVGIYSYSHAWGNPGENLSSFTPNTIFVPHSSVSSDMDHSNRCFFQTLVLHNDALAAFNALMAEADCGDYFICHDQGYSLISGVLPVYDQIAQRSMVIGLAAWGVLMLLFMLLFPVSQGKAMRTMTALGATRGKRMAHILLSAAGILIPGTVIGLGAGYLLWDKVAAWVAENAGSVLNLEMDAGVLALIALAQLAAALALTALISIPLSRHRGIKRRR